MLVVVEEVVTDETAKVYPVIPLTLGLCGWWLVQRCLIQQIMNTHIHLTYNFSYKIIHHLIHLHIHNHIQPSKTHILHHIHLHIQFHIEHPIILYREYKKNEQLYFLGSYWSYKNGKTFKFEYKTDSEHWAMHIWCINFKKFKMFHVEHLNIWLFYYVQLTQD